MSGLLCGAIAVAPSYPALRTPHAAGGWHTLLVRAAGGRIEMHVDGVLITTWADATPLPAHGFGLMTLDGAASFDDIKVYGLATRSYYLFGAARVGERVTHLAESASAGDLYALHSDHLGSVSLATDAWGMTVTLSLARYYPFGAERGAAASGSPTESWPRAMTGGPGRCSGPRRRRPCSLSAAPTCISIPLLVNFADN